MLNLFPPSVPVISLIFFFNDTATTEIYTLSLHDALPISETADVTAGTESTPRGLGPPASHRAPAGRRHRWRHRGLRGDRGLERVRRAVHDRHHRVLGRLRRGASAVEDGPGVHPRADRGRPRPRVVRPARHHPPSG